MDAPTLHGLWTLVILVTFVAIVVWAWSGRNRAAFDEASRIPLEDDDERPAAAAMEGRGRPEHPDRNGAQHG